MRSIRRAEILKCEHVGHIKLIIRGAYPSQLPVSWPYYQMEVVLARHCLHYKGGKGWRGNLKVRRLKTNHKLMTDSHQTSFNVYHFDCCFNGRHQTQNER